MRFKLLDNLKQYMRSKGVIVRNPVKRKVCHAKTGQCKFIDSYDFEADLLEKAEEEAKLRSLPHKDEN